MTTTTNYGLKKIDDSDNWRTIGDDHNDSMDSIESALTGQDAAVANLADGLAIVTNGNTHAAIAEGQYVYVRKHSSLAEGLYKATSAISANATLSTSNLTADGQGGLNDLKGQVDSLNSNFTNYSVGTFSRFNRTVLDKDNSSGSLSYTVPADGWYHIVAGCTTNSSEATIRLNNISILYAYGLANMRNDSWVILRKNTVLSLEHAAEGYAYVEYPIY